MRRIALWVIAVWILQPVNAQILTSALADDQLAAFKMQHFPASFHPDNLKSDLLITGGSANFYSNIFFLKNTNLFGLKSRIELTKTMQESQSTDSKMDAIGLGFHTGRSRYQAAVQASFYGPAIWFRINENWSAGLYSRIAVLGSAGDIPDEINYPTYDSKPIHQPFSIRAFSGYALSMASFGLHLSRKLSLPDWDLNLGLNVQWNLGMDMLGLKMNQDIRAWTKLRNDDISISNASAQWQYTYSNENPGRYKLKVKGHGASVDFGFAIKPNKSNLKWEALLSLNQIGFITYSKSTEIHDIEFTNTIELNSSELSNFEDLRTYSANLKARIMGGDNDSSISNKIMVATAGSISGSFLIHLDSHIQFQSLFSMPFSKADPRIIMGIQYNFRYWKIFPYATLTGWQAYSPGMAVRAGYLTLGTNNISAFFNSDKLEHADFYLLLSFNRAKSTSKKFKKMNYHKCYSF